MAERQKLLLTWPKDDCMALCSPPLKGSLCYCSAECVLWRAQLRGRPNNVLYMVTSIWSYYHGHATMSFANCLTHDNNGAAAAAGGASESLCSLYERQFITWTNPGPEAARIQWHFRQSKWVLIRLADTQKDRHWQWPENELRIKCWKQNWSDRQTTTVRQ